MRTQVVGHRFEPRTFIVGEHLATLPVARALDLKSDELYSVRAARDSGYAGRPVLPSMLGFMLTVSDDDLTEQLGFTWGQTLNVAIDVEWAGVPVGEEDELTGTSEVEAMWERAKGDDRVRQFLRLRTDFTRGGVPVARWRVLFLETRQGSVDPDAPADDPGLALTGESPFPDPAPDLDNGHARPLPGHDTAPLDRVAFARLSVGLANGDPVHLDDAVGAEAGLQAVVGHGAAVLAMLHEPVRLAYGLQRPVRMATTQKAPFRVGDVLRATGEARETDTGWTTAQTTVRVGDEAIASADIIVASAPGDAPTGT